ncbi:hypothetical protein JRO89_XS13G0012600 [Xanthoceras sorbifolium]|uniref:Endonuclease/exonuclease/phosphatase domain-containing protein n=1 Tax=Xanthoceras sorbifolium TaxID=99658 RepID=A0ABQ8H609_9ROSI|nr:hypothetical protein JRO89_XS13G0012600 [Xanthoceras sorbifolium]
MLFNDGVERFTVVSYNILGDKNASKHKDLYPNVPSQYMKWSHRKRLISQELFGWNPDIICMQEVDRYFDLSSFMEKAGYVGSYKGRTGDNIDGCATFWKADKFRLIEEVNIEFKEFGLRDNVAQISVFEVAICACFVVVLHFFAPVNYKTYLNLISRMFLNRKEEKIECCVYEFFVLCIWLRLCSSTGAQMRRAKSRKLVVGNIHVLYNAIRGEVKLCQICLLSSRAQVISEKWGNAPVVLAGDFNITPQSAIYQFLSSSELNIKLYDRRELSGQRSCHPAQVFGPKKEMSNPFAVIDSLQLTLLNTLTSLQCCLFLWCNNIHIGRHLFGLPRCFDHDSSFNKEVKVATGRHDCHLAVHPLKLYSSYASVKGSTKTRGLNDEPLATSYHFKFFGTVDYIWYSNGLVPTRVLDTLLVDTLRRTGGLPSKSLGSDHLALVSEFAFVPGTTKEGDKSTVSNYPSF